MTLLPIWWILLDGKAGYPIMGIEQYWPFFGLRISTPDLELWIPTDEDLAQVMELVGRGVHDPASMPFLVPWTDAESPALERGALQYWWRGRATLSADAWSLPFAVAHQGTMLGVQELSSTAFPTLRVAETGSWLGLAHQGQGFGKKMRRAVLHLAFEHLGARAVTSSAFHDNPASQAVSRAVGYVDNGRSFAERRGKSDEQVQFLITRERWLETRTDDPITVSGFDACADVLGLSD